MFESLKAKKEREEQEQRIAAAEAQLEADRRANGERNTQAGKADAKVITTHAHEIRENELIGYGLQVEQRIATETGTITDLERAAVEWRRHVEVEIANAEHEIVISRDTGHQLETGRRLAGWREVLRLTKAHLSDREVETNRHRDSLKRDRAELVKTEKELAEVQRQIQKAA